MLKEYFQIIRKALSEKRVKGKVYYEAHHIVPRSFNKQSNVVLLTPQEHYECHKLLADIFKQHSIYGQKMLWAFHRIAYSKKRKLTANEYAEARILLMNLWTRKKTEEHKEKIGKAQVGNTNNKSRVYEGMKSDMSEEGRKKLAEARVKDQTGKIGLDAKASKGTVVLEYIDGKIVETGSALQLSIQTGIPQPTISDRLRKFPGIMKKGFKIYYKTLP
jgi:hypothetical protein